MWAATVARELFSDWGQYAFYLKPLFYLPLWTSFQISEELALWPMQSARFLFSLNLGLIIILTGSILRRLYPDERWKVVLGALLLISSALILERGYRVRSDLMICSLYLVSIYTLLTLKPKAFSLLAGFTPALLALLVSLNSLFFIPFLFPFIKHSRLRRPLWITTLCFLILAVLFLLGSSFLHSWKYFLESFTEQSAGLSYFSWKRFEHIVNWVFKDPHLFALFGLKISHDFVFWRKYRSFSSLKVPFFGYWIIFVLLIHPNRMPFFMASLLPFLILWSLEVPLLISFVRKHPWRKHLHTAAALLLFLLTAHMAFHSWRIFDSSTNSVQRNFMTELGRQIPKDKSLRIWDPVGVLPFHPSYLWYLGPSQEKENRFLYEIFQQVQPKLLITTQRTTWMPREFYEDLASSYIQIHEGLYLRIFTQTTEPVSEMQVEDLLGEIFGFYPWLEKDWSFTFEFLDQNHKPVQVELVSFTGDSSILTQPLILSRFFDQEFLRMTPPIASWKIIPQPYLQMGAHPPLKELFRFDAGLGAELTP